MDNQTDFITEIDKYKVIIDKNIMVSDIDFTINLSKFDKKACNIINNWKDCLDFLGKSHLFKTKQIMKIVYCLLTNNYIINNVNGNQIDLDIYDPILNRFLRIDIADEKNRYIKLKVFSVCNAQIIIDCKDLRKYKIYEIHNIAAIKEYYGTNKINIDVIVTELQIQPKFVGTITQLNNDYKKLINIDTYGLIITELENFMKHSIKLEKQILCEFKKLRYQI